MEIHYSGRKEGMQLTLSGFLRTYRTLSRMARYERVVAEFLAGGVRRLTRVNVADDSARNTPRGILRLKLRRDKLLSEIIMRSCACLSVCNSVPRAETARFSDNETSCFSNENIIVEHRK